MLKVNLCATNVRRTFSPKCRQFQVNINSFASRKLGIVKLQHTQRMNQMIGVNFLINIFAWVSLLNLLCSEVISGISNSVDYNRYFYGFCFNRWVWFKRPNFNFHSIYGYNTRNVASVDNKTISLIFLRFLLLFSLALLSLRLFYKLWATIASNILYKIDYNMCNNVYRSVIAERCKMLRLFNLKSKM